MNLSAQVTLLQTMKSEQEKEMMLPKRLGELAEHQGRNASEPVGRRRYKTRVLRRKLTLMKNKDRRRIRREMIITST